MGKSPEDPLGLLASVVILVKGLVAVLVIEVVETTTVGLAKRALPTTLLSYLLLLWNKIEQGKCVALESAPVQAECIQVEGRVVRSPADIIGSWCVSLKGKKTRSAIPQ